MESKENFKKKVEGLKKNGFVPLALADSFIKVKEIVNDKGDYKAPEGEQAACHSGFGIGEGSLLRSLSGVADVEDATVAVEGVGTPDLGYVKYGPGDRLPSTMSRIASLLPYTAKAMEYNTDVKVGLGPRLMYHSSYYASGALRDVCIPFASAGTWLKGRIQDVRAKMAEEKGDGPSPVIALFGSDGVGEQVKLNDSEVGTLQDELDSLLADYKEWERTSAEVEEFMRVNDIEDHYMKCMLDDSHFDLYYPTIGLERGKQREWNGKIVRIGWLPTVATRMEQMDKSWNINYVYFSDLWRQNSKDVKVTKDDVVAYPALFASNFQDRLSKIVSDYRNKPVNSRPLWFACPTFYPSVGRPYYPLPVWFSLFPTKVLDYASTLIYDKAIAKQNSTMWGKMVFINLTYFKQICDSEGIDTPEEAAQKKAELQESINTFLKRRENNGKVLFTDSFLSDDQKELYKAIEIVDVPQNTNARETKDELEEIASIILFVFGIHPSLIGATPGKTPSSGGTQQRELHLLKQIQVSPRQRKYLAFLDRIARWNSWDRHASWEIQMPVLTTLDRNSSGIEMQSQG